MRRNRWTLVPLAALVLAGTAHGRDAGAPRYVVETYT